MNEAQYKVLDAQGIEAITRPHMRDTIKKYYALGLRDYALGLSVGESLPQGTNAISIPFPIVTPFDRERAIMVNMMCQAYLSGFNRYVAH